MKFRMKVCRTGCEDADGWWEDYDTETCSLVDDDDDAETAANKIVDFFNSTLRPRESSRRVLAVEEVS